MALASSFLVSCGYDRIESLADPKPEGSLKAPAPAPTPFTELDQGFWGNGVVRMEVLDQRARLDFACARGEIFEKIIVSDFSYSFAVNGIYVEDGVIHRALYSGDVNERHLKLRVAYEKNDHEYARVYDLTYGMDDQPATCRR